VIDAAALLKDLQAELGRLVADLNAKVAEDVEVRAGLEGEWRKAFDAQRTGRTFEDWLDDRLTQVAVAWLLACVFVRFGEDNGLIDEARIAGPGVRGAEARDAQQRFFVEHPHSNDREYLQDVFRSSARLRGLDGVVGEGESPLWLVDPPADAATRLVALFRTADEAGDLAHDFTDPDLDTRFLGDLYQDLSEHAKSTYALLQTPEFVEEFILDRTLTPAIETFGLAKTTLIDPTCGSGHFLLGGFQRLFKAWRSAEPGESVRVHAERAMGAVTGVDLNPFAAAIARFRLLVAAVKACGERRLADAPDFHVDVAVGDSLLWGARPGQLRGMESASAAVDRQFLYRTEHAEVLRRIFDRQYAAVVGNPPYIIARDPALNDQYRMRYPNSCAGKYSLAAPFMQCFFELGASNDGSGRPAGYVGMITANSFMKRSFGKPLVTKMVPTWDLTHVVDTSGIDIPGHGTPTVILFGRNQRPMAPVVRAAMGVRSDPRGLDDPAEGPVWQAILGQIDQAGSRGDFIEVEDIDRPKLARHPWVIGGGGAGDLKERIDGSVGATPLGVLADVGVVAVLGEEEVICRPSSQAWIRSGLTPELTQPVYSGEAIRDWTCVSTASAAFPYDERGQPIEAPSVSRVCWPWRTSLDNLIFFGKTRSERGLRPIDYGAFMTQRFVSPVRLAFAFKASHNHVALHSGAGIFKQTAPVAVPLDGLSQQTILVIAGCLNAALANFWVRQVAQPYEAPEPWGARYERDASRMATFPVVDSPRVANLAAALHERAQKAQLLGDDVAGHGRTPLSSELRLGGSALSRIRSEMVSLQEELDWECLHSYGLTREAITAPAGLEAPPLNLGERAFEIVLARRMMAGEVESTWFERHGSVPITEMPRTWPGWYRELVGHRISLIESDRDVALIERPDHKRRWDWEPWSGVLNSVLSSWLKDLLEDRELWFEGTGEAERAVCRSVAQLTDQIVATNPAFMEVARLWKGVVEVDPVQVVAELVADEHVPAQSGARYKVKGFDKRRQWERTWELQRLEDEGQPLPDGLDRIPVPPKYGAGDFAKASFWKQRGKLDVPKERFTSIAGAERDADPTLVLAWAGFDHAQLAQAVGTLIEDRKQSDGWDAERCWPLVVAMAEQLFWLDLWHNEVDPRWGASPAGLYRGIVEQHALAANKTLADVADWRAPAATRGRKKKDGA
jgi:hypothetical protein